MKPFLRKVNYYETDKMGVTHHSNYIRYMEEARIYVMEQLGYGFDKLEADGFVSPVVNLEARFIRTTGFADLIRIDVAVDDLTPLKLIFKYTMKVGECVVFTGKSTHCFIKNGKPAVIEDSFPGLVPKLLALKSTI